MSECNIGQTPIADLLRRVPPDAGYDYQEGDGPTWCHIPVGRYCEEAASIIDWLNRERDSQIDEVAGLNIRVKCLKHTVEYYRDQLDRIQDILSRKCAEDFISAPDDAAAAGQET